MSSVFAENLSFERPHLIPLDRLGPATQKHDVVYDAWLFERKVKIMNMPDWAKEELGDSCCFGTRTVETSMNDVRRLHCGI